GPLAPRGAWPKRRSTARRLPARRASSRASSSWHSPRATRRACAPSWAPRSNGGGLRTRPLREAEPRELRPLLDEEAALWHSELGWDFADVRAGGSGGVEMGSLPGPRVGGGGRA